MPSMTTNHAFTYKKFTNRKNPAKLSYIVLCRDPEPADCGISISRFCWTQSFDVRDYFHDLFVGGKFYQFYPLDASFYD